MELHLAFLLCNEDVLLVDLRPKKLTGKAGQEVKRLLSMPSLNIAFGSSYLDAFMTKYEGDKVATLIAYNAGPVAADRFIKFNRDRSTLPRQTQNYLTKAGL